MRVKKKMRTRLAPEIRKKQILKAAIELSLEIGYCNLSLTKIARKANVATGLIIRYFVKVNSLKMQVMKTAIKEEILPIIAEGLTLKNKYALKAPEELKLKAVKNLIS